MRIYTAFCQSTDGRGTIWIDTVEVEDNPEDPDATVAAAKRTAREACANDWEYDVEDVHCLGLAVGSVEIAEWDDLND